jgi:hypothetical protein
MRKISILLSICFTVAVLLAISMIPPTNSQESQQRVTPLKDVCPEGWSRYHCAFARLCIYPAVERQYALTESVPWRVEGCTNDEGTVPDAWAHASPEILGYLAQAWRWRGYSLYTHVVNLSSPTGIANLQFALPGDDNGYDKGFAKFEAPQEISLDSYKIPLPSPKSPVTDVCPAHWSRFSCRLVRLCVSPGVAGNYDMSKSKELDNADCKADDRSVPEEETHSSPEDVGFFAGALLNGPRYFKSVKIDSSDIFDRNIEEAIQRLVLVPIPVGGLMEYDRGFEKGQMMFKEYLRKNGEKELNRPH